MNDNHSQPSVGTKLTTFHLNNSRSSVSIILKSQRLRNISNLAFGGMDLKTAYLGCLLGDSIASFTMPVAGHPLPHWNADIEPLLQAKGLVR